MEWFPNGTEHVQEQHIEGRRKVFRRKADRTRMNPYPDKLRKFESLLELGQLIGHDLKLDEMLLKIAQKAVEVMEADRCSVFLYDPASNQLWSTVAMGMGEQVIRMPSGVGIAGFCFKTGETVNLADAYRDVRFNKEVDAKTGYHTNTVLCMPLCNRKGERLGAIQLLNKKEGLFTREDETFLKTFGNHAAVFIEMVQLQKARIDALQQSRQDLERLNRAKSKALDHLSHELRTPLSIIQGKVRMLKKNVQGENPSLNVEKTFEILERHLNRLQDIQQETDRIIRSYHGTRRESIPLYPFAEKNMERTLQRASHRNLRFLIEGVRDLTIVLDPVVLEDTLESLLKNAVENTPEEGTIKVLLEQRDPHAILRIQDFGIGITPESQRSIFEGLFHAQATDLYSSKRPYDFNAGGKGLDLLRIKAYGQRFGFDLQLKSRRCPHLPTERDLCPGKISLCPYCRGTEDCMASGGSTFSLLFQREERSGFGKG